jgi:propanol-preferring alcohol dehydrogenase
VATLAAHGRAVGVAITDEEFGLDPFRDLVRKEAEVLGAADHLASEIPVLLEMARRGDLNLTDVVTRVIPLELKEVEAAMQRLEAFGDDIRTVILP